MPVRATEWLSALCALWWSLCLAAGVAAGDAIAPMATGGWGPFLAVLGGLHLAALAAPARHRLTWLRAAAAVAAAAAWTFVAVVLARTGLAAASGAYAGLAALNLFAAWGLWHDCDG
jgi:uncharacterized membrane protein YjjP (DUF1212 family)